MSALASQSLIDAVTTGAVDVRSVSKSLDERVVLEDVSFSIDPGEFVAIVGANGAGKSTLLRVLSTLTRPSSGDVLLFGQSTRSRAERLRARIGMIAHQSMLYRDLSARQNIEFFANLYGKPNAKQRAMRMLEMVGLADRADDAVKTFSRGMVQRLAVARSLVHDPELLLADEPFEGLDASAVESMRTLLGDLHHAGKTIVIVHHDIEQTLSLARRAIVLRRGRVAIDRATCGLSAADVLAEVG